MTVLLYQLNKWDVKLFSSIFRLSEKQIVARLVYLISKSGDGYLYPVIAIVLLINSSAAGFQFLKTVSAAFMIEVPIYLLVKNTVKRSRPYAVLHDIKNIVVPIDKFSFPSGHTAGAVIIAMQLSYYLPPIQSILYLWATMVALSRVCLGVHYPGDIIAGGLLGWLSSWAGILLLI